MPLWQIYHSPNLYSADDKAKLASRITDVYNGNSKYITIPRFYVGIVFVAVEPESFFISGQPVDNFVRIAVDHIAREFHTEDLKAHWIGLIEDAIKPYVKDRGVEYEFHIDETPIDLWSIQGFRPPPPDSATEKKWIRENKATAY